MTRDETRFLLGRISLAYGRAAPTQALVDEWARALEHVNASAAHTALDALIADGSPGPNVAQLTARARAADNSQRTAYTAEPWAGANDAGRAAIARAKATLAQARRTTAFERDNDPW